MSPDARTDVDALWAGYKQDGARDVRDQLILHYSPLVKYVAGRVAVGLPQNVEQSDAEIVIAGLLADLKARGLFDSTLVIWGGEFGRMPMSEGSNGRDHNPHGYCMWLAGAGVKGGQVIGATDAVGLRAVEDTSHVHDIHATILHLLGLDHEALTFRHNGRDERLTDVAGNVIRRALA